MSFAQSARMVLMQKYADFSGRAPRAEFWRFALLQAIIFAAGSALALLIISRNMGAGEGGGVPLAQRIEAGIIIGLLGLYALATLLPAIAVSVRRLHDLDYSGRWAALLYIGSLLPMIGGIISVIAIIIMALKGTKGANRFGPDPLAFAAGRRAGAFVPAEDCR